VSNAPGSGVAPRSTHYLLVSLLAAGGLLVGVAAYFVARLFPGISNDDLAVTQSILTNLGIGFFSAAVLFLLEPKFRRAVKADVTDTVTDTVRTATAGLKDEVREAVQEDFENRIATLEDRINARYDAKLKEQLDLVNDLGSHFTHERVSKLFEEAATLRALHENALLVEADDEIHGKRGRKNHHRQRRRDRDGRIDQGSCAGWRIPNPARHRPPTESPQEGREPSRSRAVHRPGRTTAPTHQRRTAVLRQQPGT
jgi:hypothetical protein